MASLLVGLVALEWFIVWIVSNMSTTTELFELLEMILPEAVRALITSQIGNLSFPGMVGFGFQHPVVLAATIGLMLVLATLPAAERESGFLDLILARPVSRGAYLSGVISAMIVCAAMLPLALVAGAAAGLSLVDAPDEIPWFRYFHSASRLTALLLCVGGYALLLASRCRRRGPAVAQAVGLTLVFFWFNLMARLWAPLGRFAWLTPFDYFDPIDAATGAHAPLLNPAILLIVFALCSAGALRLFARSDL
jgi:ABC-2 type transport system permease protein